MEGVVNLGDASVQKTEGGNFEKTPVRRIKMTAGQSIRMTFLSDDVVSRLRHYSKGVGYRRCTSYAGFCPGCIAAERNSEFSKGKDFKRASEAFGANVLVYETDPSLQQISQNVGFINLFVFGTEKFSSLRTIKQMYGSLVGLDLLVTCIDGDFQKMTITPYPKEQSFCNIPDIAKVIANKAKTESYPLDKMIAKEVSPAQMIKDFALNPAIMNLPEAKSFQEVAENMATQQPAQQFYSPGAAPAPTQAQQAAPQQTAPPTFVPPAATAPANPAPPVMPAAAPVSPQPRTVDTASLLDEL